MFDWRSSMFVEEKTAIFMFSQNPVVIAGVNWRSRECIFCKPLWWSCWRMFYSRWRVYRLIFLHQDRLCHTFILIKLLKLPLLFTSSPFQFDFHFSASFHPLFQRFLLFCTSQTRIQDKDKYSWWSFSAKIVKTL